MVESSPGCFIDRRLRWSVDVQIRSESFGAIAYDRKAQRLMLMRSALVARVADLLVGDRPAREELASLGCDPDEIEDLLSQLYAQSIVEIVDESTVPMVVGSRVDLGVSK